MAKKRSIIPRGRIEQTILLVRGERAIIDTDLAVLYGVTTKALNQAVTRNPGRFPPDFMFRLSKVEKGELVTNRDHLRGLKYSPALPRAFTEHGAIMVASVRHCQPARCRIRCSILPHCLAQGRKASVSPPKNPRFSARSETMRSHARVP